MKKRWLAMTAVAAALTLSTGMTAFAAGWQQDSTGWFYQYEDGSYAWCGWFTDPADNSIYYLDPDGYMMSDTVVEGYRLGSDGRRIEKTAEELAKETQKKKETASKNTPGKQLAAADLAADAAKEKESVAATSNVRKVFQSEMKVFMDRAFNSVLKGYYANKNEDFNGSTSLTVYETIYDYTSLDGRQILNASLWHVTNKTSSRYHESALDLTYDRNVVTNAEEISWYEDAFKTLTIAALGETEGQTVLDSLYAQIASGVTSINHAGTTNAGNAYTFTYRDGKISISVTCNGSLVTPTTVTTSAEADEADADED